LFTHPLGHQQECSETVGSGGKDDGVKKANMIKVRKVDRT
jgi:hypothetical protein